MADSTTTSGGAPLTGRLLTDVHAGVGRITISNPTKFNAMNAPMWEGVATTLAAWETDPAVRVVLLQGDGDKAFVSGADIGQISKGHDDGELSARMERAVSAAYRAPTVSSKPVIAKIRGICMGGGLGLAAACDLRICSDDARFRMPAGRLGIGYKPDGVDRFVAMIGVQNTLDIFYTARIFDAAHAEKIGFVLRVVPAAELDEVVDQLVQTIAGNAPLTLKAVKMSVSQVLSDPAQRDPAILLAALRACRDSEDFREGARAFLEKRQPVFTGR